ncbi:MAG: sensor domain-containing diguanylate cyclase [Clostridiaceae bacterium]
MAIDIRTVALFYFIANVMNNSLILIIWRTYRKHFRGLSFLLVDMCLQTAGSLCLLLRGVLPDQLSIVLTNLFSVSGTFFILGGLERFFNHHEPRVYNYLFISIYMFLILFFSILKDNLLVRNPLLSSMVILANGQSSFLLLHEIGQDFRRLARFTAYTLLAYCIVSMIRIAALLLLPQQSNDFFDSGIVNSSAMIVYSTLNILLTAGLILMVSQRVLNEMQTEKDKYTKAFHSSPNSILLTKVSDGKIFEVNENFVKTTGYQPEEVIGKTTLEVGLWIAAEDRAEFVNDLMDGDVQGKALHFRTKGGASIIGLVSATRIMAYGEDCILTSISDITEMTRIKEKLEVMALHDTMTGLPNRQLFYDRAGVAFANAKRDQLSVAVVSLDVDRLKAINDRWGHAAGDQILVTVGSRLLNLLRKGDTVSRFGGDEFLVLLNGIDRTENFTAVVQRIIDCVSEPILFESSEIVVSVSVGIAVYPSDGSEIEALIRKSDEAMYYTKEHGRNGFKYYNEIGQ